MDEKTEIRSYKDLKVWEISVELSVEIYKKTKCFPNDEIYGITSQIRRSAVSIPSNIAEGYSRYRRLEFKKFLQIAFASGAELETQLLISKKIGYLNGSDYEYLIVKLTSIMKMLNSLICKIKSKK